VGFNCNASDGNAQFFEKCYSLAGKLERYHKTIKGDSIRVKTPLSLADAIMKTGIAGLGRRMVVGVTGLYLASHLFEDHLEPSHG